MRLGGNGNARTYFRKHGFTELYGGKAKKKYTSKAAMSYKAELKKLVEKAAQQRGELKILDGKEDGKEEKEDGGGGAAAVDLLEKLELGDKAEEQREAKLKLAIAREKAVQPTAKPTLKLASQLSGSSKLMIRKPTSTTSGANSSNTSTTNMKLLTTGSLGMRKPTTKSLNTNGLKLKMKPTSRPRTMALKLPTSSSSSSSNGNNTSSSNGIGY